MYVEKNLKFRKINIFKSRSFQKRSKFYIRKKLPKWLKKNSLCIFFKNSTFVELNFLKFILFRIRRCFVRKNYYLTIRLKPNFMFSKKSTNARMGKGSGAFKRPVRKIKIDKPLISSYKLPLSRFNGLKKILRKKYPNVIL